MSALSINIITLYIKYINVKKKDYIMVKYKNLITF